MHNLVMAFSPCYRVLIMNNQIDYIEETLSIIHAPLWWHIKGLHQTMSGYGSKLTTSKKVKYNGKLYRVYCVCYSNAGSAYILAKGKRLFLRQH
jgi:hypothetical protein